MNFIKHCLTVVITLLSLQSIAQQKDNPYANRLYIGDKVDMESIVFNNMRNYPGGKAKLSDFKGKYIILDFWTKNCNSCIAAFPHMEELQNQFKSDIQVLLVTKNQEAELALLLKNSPNVKNTKLPMILGDQILATKLFPHATVPYHVWLNREGRVVATTYGGQANAENLKALILGKQLNLPVMNEVLDMDLVNEVRDQKKSLLKVANGSFKNNLKYYAQIPMPKIGDLASSMQSSIHELPYYSFFLSYIPGEMMHGDRGLVGSILKDEKGNEKGFRIAQFTVKQFYQAAYDAIDLKIVPEGKAKFFYKEYDPTTDWNYYEMNNSYCYESSLPDYNFDSARKLLQQDLARFFGMVGDIEERELKSMALIRLNTGEEKNLWAKKQLPKPLDANLMAFNITKESYFLRNSGIKKFFTDLSDSNKSLEDPLFFDETNFSRDEKQKTVEITLNCGLSANLENISHLRKELAKYGLGLKEDIRKVKVLVLKPAI